MNNREKLEEIRNDYNWETRSCDDDMYFQDYFKQIDKDLEILEILKKYIRVNELRETPQIMTGSPNVDFVLNVVKKALDSSIFLDLMLQEDAKEIKEWLKK